jgi:hypothetical protein
MHLHKNNINEAFAEGKELLTKLLSELDDISVTLLRPAWNV